MSLVLLLRMLLALDSMIASGPGMGSLLAALGSRPRFSELAALARERDAELVGGDETLAAHFQHGHFANLYLSPKDYHRIHMPCDGTLQRMIERLESKRSLADALSDYEELADLADASGIEDDDLIDQAALQSEIDQLKGFQHLAENITSNAKGSALLAVLDKAFDFTERLGGQRKAVIFTESARTQAWLFEQLGNAGYAGKVVLLNGTNNDADSVATLQAWQQRHAGSPRISGSRNADMKAALVERFREQASIMICTEAGAEGINLQFCSLLINYDLRWNPQRVEQRRVRQLGRDVDIDPAPALPPSQPAASPPPPALLPPPSPPPPPPPPPPVVFALICSWSKAASVLRKPSRSAVTASPRPKAGEAITLKCKCSRQKSAACVPPWPSNTPQNANPFPAGACTMVASSMCAHPPRSAAARSRCPPSVRRRQRWQPNNRPRPTAGRQSRPRPLNVRSC